jgi:hypothetical protein
VLGIHEKIWIDLNSLIFSGVIGSSLRRHYLGDLYYVTYK